MYVITADQRSSRRNSDAVPGLITAFAGDADRWQLLLPFERTAGDEVQAVVAGSRSAVNVLVELIRRGDWWIGLGVGRIDAPFPASARAGRGPAYIAARAAVEAAKSTSTGISVRSGGAPAPTGRAESSAWLLATLLTRRTPSGWEVVERMRRGARQIEVAGELGISPQAVSSRLRVAGWLEQERGETLLAWLLAQIDDAEAT